MRILIFDDDEKDINTLMKCCECFFKKRNIEYEIEICKDIQFLKKNINFYDLLFLDIEINSLNGIDIGLELRKSNEDCRIIITSNYAEYLIDGYKISAERYFIKPITQHNFDIEMEAVIYRFFRKFVGIYDESICNRKIYFSEILYIDFLNRKTRLHLFNGNVISTNYPLKYWIDKLDKYSFGQSHKSYLVNFNYISAFTKQDIVLSTEELVPISRHFKQKFNQMYFEYLHNTL